MPIEVTLEKITPEIARQYIELNASNQRNLREAVVSKYARDMKSGKWMPTNDAISFDDKGNLINGNHRLHAVVKSGETVEMLVARGLAPEAMSVIDNGASRKITEQLKVLNPNDPIYSSTSVHAFIRFICSVVGDVQSQKHKFSVNEMKDCIDEYYGACLYIYKINPGAKYINIYVMCGLLCAKISGVSDADIDVARKYLISNENTSGKYNWKALADFKQRCIEGKYRGYWESYLTQFNEAKKALYLFFNNVNSTRKTEIYEIDKSSLKRFSDLFFLYGEVNK